jgi:hypothetical protein
MATTKRRYGKEEFAKRGDAVYENDVRPHLSADDEGKFAAIDIESGFYEINENELEACDRLRARVPDAQIWMVRIGSRTVHRFGGRERLDVP